MQFSGHTDGHRFGAIEREGEDGATLDQGHVLPEPGVKDISDLDLNHLAAALVVQLSPQLRVLEVDEKGVLFVLEWKENLFDHQAISCFFLSHNGGKDETILVVGADA